MSDADMDKVTAGFSQNQVNDPTPGSMKNLDFNIGAGHSNGTLSCGGANRLGFSC
jgi:hypothetical protein